MAIFDELKIADFPGQNMLHPLYPINSCHILFARKNKLLIDFVINGNRENITIMNKFTNTLEGAHH